MNRITYATRRPLAPLRYVTFANRRILFGHTWEPVAGVQPSLRCAMEFQDPPVVPQRRIRHGQWAIECARNRGQEVRLHHSGGTWIPLDPGFAHIYAPGLTLWERLRNADDNVHVAFILFDAPQMAELRELTQPGKGFARIPDVDGHLLELLHETALIGGERGDDGIWEAEARLFQILDRVFRIRRQGSVAGGNPANAQSLARVIKRLLREHMTSSVELPFLAQQAGVSVSTLTHRYRLETGETPMRTLMNMRLRLAEGLLLKGHRLKEIASQTGFADGYHLSRTFRRVLGRSPRQFLKRELQDASAKTASAEAHAKEPAVASRRRGGRAADGWN